jgi:hypothetical protein
MNVELTKTQRKIVEAVRRGYSILNGCVYGLKGKPLKLGLHGSQRYPTFTVNFDKEAYGIPVHLFAAYLYYGEKAFDKKLVVRHLRNDTLDFTKDNIVLGTHSENNLDKPPEVRAFAAKRARAAQGARPKNAKLTMEQVERVRAFYKSLAGVKAPNGSVAKLALELGVHKVVLHNIRVGKSYAS